LSCLLRLVNCLFFSLPFLQYLSCLPRAHTFAASIDTCVVVGSRLKEPPFAW
jgi:hypothetical protein